jgi:hypothetical protein
MHWPIQLCVGNVINEILLGYHFTHDNCEKFRNLEKMMEYVFYEVSEMIVIALFYLQ